MRRISSFFVLFAFVLAGCAATGSETPVALDAGTDASAVDGTACILGTADHCGACARVCSGNSVTNTTAVCSDTTTEATCDITCHGEFYDLNGRADDGCEAEDPVVQDWDLAATAESLPASFDTTGATTNLNPLDISGIIYGDTRMHDSDPTSRPLGREDWYKVSVIGDGDPMLPMTAYLSLTALPNDNVFEVCISDSAQKTFPASRCATAHGGPVQRAQAPASNNVPSYGDQGIYFVKVRKVSGTNSPNAYTLRLSH